VGIFGVIIAGIISYRLQPNRTETIHHVFLPGSGVASDVDQQQGSAVAASHGKTGPGIAQTGSTSVPPASEKSARSTLSPEVVTDDEIVSIVAELKIAEQEGDKIEVFIRQPPKY
jgi:hypothetical protein